jgi:hypothetical protein
MLSAAKFSETVTFDFPAEQFAAAMLAARTTCGGTVEGTAARVGDI